MNSRPRADADPHDPYPRRTATGSVLAAVIFLLGALVYVRHALLVALVFLLLAGLSGAAAVYMYRKDVRRARLPEEPPDRR